MNGSIPRLLGAAALIVMTLTAQVGTVAAPAGRYTYPAPGTVYDTKTKLTWQQLPTSRSLNFLEAKDYCSGLGATLGGTGWRLPTSKELQTIVDESRSTPAIDPTAFPGTPSNYFYTSGSLVVDFLTGAAHSPSTIPNSQAANVRCVRAGGGGTSGAGGVGGSGAGGAGTGGAGGGCATACTSGTTQCLSGTSLQTCGVGSDGCPTSTTSSCSTGLVCERYAPADCVDPTWAEWTMPNSQGDVAAGAPNPEAYTDDYLDGAVIDKVTGLMWQKALQTGTWAQAIAFCPTLTLGGYHDWRLPSRIELVSLIDPAPNPNPMLSTFGFPATYTVWMSSSPVPGQTSSAFAVGALGINSFDTSTTASGIFHCVR